jgi:hypothetical protein
MYEPKYIWTLCDADGDDINISTMTAEKARGRNADLRDAGETTIWKQASGILLT